MKRGMLMGKREEKEKHERVMKDGKEWGDFFRKKRLIFWDFDGVIKESVGVKTEAFVRLFSEFGEEIQEKVRRHHLANGGMSRFEKFPLYLSWAGIGVNDGVVEEYCRRFRELAMRGVIDSPWVPGVEAILRENPYGQTFILVTATPEGEIWEILDVLGLRGCFWKVVGAPVSKAEGIRCGLQDFGVGSSEALMVGDALADLKAAEVNGVDFLLRETEENREVFAGYGGWRMGEALTEAQRHGGGEKNDEV